MISIVNINWHIPSSSSFSLSLSLCVSSQWLDALPLSLDVAGVYSLVIALIVTTKNPILFFFFLSLFLIEQSWSDVYWSFDPLRFGSLLISHMALSSMEMPCSVYYIIQTLTSTMLTKSVSSCLPLPYAPQDLCRWTPWIPQLWFQHTDWRAWSWGLLP